MTRVEDILKKNIEDFVRERENECKTTFWNIGIILF